MTPRDIAKNIFLWLFYVLLHLFVCRHLVLFDRALCFVYIGAILFLSTEISPILLLFIGFSTGIIVDSFDNTLGMHTAASTLLAYLRPMVVNSQLTQKKLDERVDLSFRALGIANFLAYTSVLAGIHLTVLLFIDAGTTIFFLTTLLKIFTSLVFTLFVLLLTQIFIR